jgi:hypothetical protein
MNQGDPNLFIRLSLETLQHMCKTSQALTRNHEFLIPFLLPIILFLYSEIDWNLLPVAAISMQARIPFGIARIKPLYWHPLEARRIHFAAEYFFVIWENKCSVYSWVRG